MERQSNSVPQKKLACFVCDDRDVVLLGRETILRDGKFGGLPDERRLRLHHRAAHRATATSATPTASPTIISAPGRYELIVAGDRQPCRLLLEAPYDPAGARSGTEGLITSALEGSRAALAPPQTQLPLSHAVPRRPPLPHPHHRGRGHRHLARLSSGPRRRQRDVLLAREGPAHRRLAPGTRRGSSASSAASATSPA